MKIDNLVTTLIIAIVISSLVTFIAVLISPYTFRIGLTIGRDNMNCRIKFMVKPIHFY